MITNNDLHLLHRYWAGNLSATESQLLEQRLLLDREFLQTATAEKLIYETTLHLNEQQGATAIQQAKQWVKDLGNDLFAPNQFEQLVQAETPDWDTPNTEPTYSLDELLAMFARCNELEENISRAATTTQTINVLHPTHDTETSKTLVFDLQQGVQVPLLLIIYDNQANQLTQIEITPNTTKFNFDVQHYTQGRYYWRLRANVSGKERAAYNTVVRSFLVRR